MCTIIEQSVILESSDDIKSNIALDYLFEYLEEIYGFLQIQDLQLQEDIIFKNLKIIRGWKLIHKNTSISGDIAKYGNRGAAIDIKHNPKLKKVIFPKLTEISNGDVALWDNPELCHPLTIDW